MKGISFEKINWSEFIFLSFLVLVIAPSPPKFRRLRGCGFESEALSRVLILKYFVICVRNAINIRYWRILFITSK